MLIKYCQYFIKEGQMSIKIFVRERRKIEKGEKKPRFRVIGTSGSGLKIHASHLRKKELEKICEETGAEAIHLDFEKAQKDGCEK